MKSNTSSLKSDRLSLTLPYRSSSRLRKWVKHSLFTAALGLSGSLWGATHYVSQNSLNPLSPYTSWATAATNIQQAIDAASPGDDVVVTNGVYASGTRVLSGQTNRVAIEKPLALRSVNGPQVTVIDGGATGRCLYLTNGASASGLTLSNGFSWDPIYGTGGGVQGESLNSVVTNCFLAGNAAIAGGGAFGCTLLSCTLTHNLAAYEGGGADFCMLTNCTLVGNQTTNAYGSSSTGGGANYGILDHCLLASNTVPQFPYDGYGGGAAYCDLHFCTLTYNSAEVGGGAYETGIEGLINQCTFQTNYASDSGGALAVDSAIPTSLAMVVNCKFSWNSTDQVHPGTGGAVSCDGPSLFEGCLFTGNAAGVAGGISGGTLINCTLTGNSAIQAGGVWEAVLTNCIVYFNSAIYESNYYDCQFTYCCTAPLPDSGDGNISDDPLLASASHLGVPSPCRGAGIATGATGVDIDGEPWGTPPSIGCDEYYGGAITGQLSVSISVPLTTFEVGYPLALTALIDGKVDTSSWNFGDGSSVIDQPFPIHAWSAPGIYQVVLRAYNDSYSSGIRATQIVNVVQPVHYVVAGNPNAVSPYSSWATAAATIQDAINVAMVPASRVIVTNGVYDRISATKPVTILSTNGPLVTIINGSGLGSCAYIADGAALSGFTLTNGVGHSFGGGVESDGSTVVSNCVLSGNAARRLGPIDPGYGGAAYNTFLVNCALNNNTADYAGGAYSCALVNCTITGNSNSFNAGAVLFSRLTNCIVYYNNSAGGSASNYNSSSTFAYCCSTPVPPGAGNIGNDPQLADAWHLSASSPCRGAGAAAYAHGTDLDGELWANPPSMGCDEYSTFNGPLTSVGIQAAYTNSVPNYALSFQGAVVGRATASRWDFGDGTISSNQLYISHAWPATGAYNVRLTAFNDAVPGGISATTTVWVVTRLIHYVVTTNTLQQWPYLSWATAATNIQDALDAVYITNSLVLVSNGMFAAGARNSSRAYVTKAATLQSVNGQAATFIVGQQVPGSLVGTGAVRCVYLASGTALSGFTLTNGATGRTGGIDPPESVESGGGVYCESTNATISNCLIVSNAASLHGGGCYLGTVVNCTILSNTAWSSINTAGGGGIYGGGYAPTVSNCVLIGNISSQGGAAFNCSMANCRLLGNWANDGGGAYEGTLNNCVVAGNLARVDGGGAEYAFLNNCTVVSNTAWFTGIGNAGSGGGIYQGFANNCILYYNTASGAGSNYDNPFLAYCCSTPLPLFGSGNITNAPAFVDFNAGNLRLASNSPCINAGNNAYAPTGPDFDGNPRISGGTVDIGAYEFQNPASQISYAWLQKFGLPADGSADFADPDHDGLNNWQEWRCGTDPTNALSVLRLLTPVRTNGTVQLTWQSAPGVNYFLQRSTNLQSFAVIATNIVSQGSNTIYMDSGATNRSAFYRVGVN
ncbi:MAG: hypothetical protein C5B50_15905 [Verrucomicrobia bacterium]|nr:MAG: hypothetical protein C5B50_15905 [Verrucomicrobiota bacterium]